MMRIQITYRVHECWQCVTNWAEQVKYAGAIGKPCNTPMLSGERSSYCPKCGKKADCASPHQTMIAELDSDHTLDKRY